MNARTALIKQLRAVLLERGIILSKGRVNLMRCVRDLVGGDPAVSARTRKLLADLRDEWSDLDRRIKVYDDEFATLTRQDAQARWPATSPGIGVIKATALLAAIDDGSAFANAARAFSGDTASRKRTNSSALKIVGNFAAFAHRRSSPDLRSIERHPRKKRNAHTVWLKAGPEIFCTTS